MRLINVRTREFEEFAGPPIPSYAILSHTWGEEEVSYADYKTKDKEYRKKSGYTKIDYACKQAEKDAIDYCWVDTCNIDKTSSAELQEAINSMFRWYEQATICYVYLVDVLHNDFHEGFKSSRWFTRGRTLQELIAPSKVEFYDKNWIYCGNRLDFESEICEITECHGLLGRTTTRLEDQAYCMLGLFNVFMPLIYGEGKKAFFRLQQEIIKVCPDQSIYAWGLPKDLSISLVRNPTLKDISQDIAWKADFEYDVLSSRLFAESASEFRHSGALVPIHPSPLSPANIGNAQTITVELPIIMPGRNFHIGLLPLRSKEYPYHSIGMILRLEDHRYCRVSWRKASDNGFAFAVPTFYAIQSHKKEITLFTQDFPDQWTTQSTSPKLCQSLFFMAGLQGNTTQILRPLDFRIMELSYGFNEPNNTSYLTFRSSSNTDEYAVIQLKLFKSLNVPVAVGVRLKLRSTNNLAIRQIESYETCSSFRNKSFYDAILLNIQSEKFVAKVVSMPTLESFVVQVLRVELKPDGDIAAQNDGFSWYTPSIQLMVKGGQAGTMLLESEHSTELQ